MRVHVLVVSLIVGSVGVAHPQDKQTILQRSENLKKHHFDAWAKGFEHIEVLIDKGSLFIALIEWEPLFDGTTPRDDVHQRLAKRLNSIPPDKFAEWQSALREKGINQPAFSFARTFVTSDHFFADSGEYDHEAAAGYLTRLQELPKKYVDRWTTTKNGTVFPEDVKTGTVLRILFKDKYFHDDRFDAKTFYSLPWDQRWAKDKHIWRDRSGKYSVEAVYDGYLGNGNIRLLREDKSQIVIGLSKLSDVDRRTAIELRKAGNQED